MTEEELKRRKTAHHEAAHAAIALALGGEIHGAVSLVPRRRWRAVAFVNGSRPGHAVTVDPGLPLVLWDVELRRMIETEIMVFLAGTHGEALVPLHPPVAALSVSNADKAASTLKVVPSAPLTAVEKAQLSSGDDPNEPPIQNDLSVAYELAEAAVGVGAAAHALLTLLDEQTRWFVQLEAPRIRRLARLLLAHEELGATAVKAALTEETWAATGSSSLAVASSRADGATGG
jgi:hypothetical protein